MARSFFALSPVGGGGLSLASFKLGHPPLLTQQDLWEAARACAPSLLFRVRTEAGGPGTTLLPGDKIESCVGLVDAAVRWRVVFQSGRNMINAVRTPALSEALWKAAQFISTQHPANVTTTQRVALCNELSMIVKTMMEQGDISKVQIGFEAAIVYHVAAIIQADNDVEAAYRVPFVQALCPFDDSEEQKLAASARLATLDTLIGGMLLAEAQNRLAERASQWMYAKMPEVEGVDKG